MERRSKRPGRPAVLPDRKRYTFWLSSTQAALIAQWQQAHGVSASQALREMIEQASKKEEN